MSLKERVDNIIAYYNNYGANDINDCINRLDTLLKNEPSFNSINPNVLESRTVLTQASIVISLFI